jgi:hypothetical protein
MWKLPTTNRKTPSRKLRGHLVLFSDGPEGLWDASIDQANVSANGFRLPLLIVASPIDLNALYRGDAIAYRLDDGTGIRYTVKPNAEPLPVSAWPLQDQRIELEFLKLDSVTLPQTLTDWGSTYLPGFGCAGGMFRM